MGLLEARGVELSWSERGEGPAVLLVHETGTGAAAFEPLALELEQSARVISYDRRGWGESTAPEGYARTTVQEQSEDAVALLAEAGAGAAVVCGAGLGALVALDLLQRSPGAAAGGVLVEPPLLGLLPEATELLSEDGRAIERVAGQGRGALVELYLSGGLAAFGSGVGRLPAELTQPARERPGILVAEIGAGPSWPTPFPQLAEVSAPVVIALGASTPPVLRDAAAALDARLPRSELHELAATEALPPHLGAPAELAALVAELSAAA
jgi:pimeloyl-ACP methyl ester carboxylesterase